MLNLILAAAVGYVAGAFTPAVGRKIKAYFVKESKVVAPAVKSAEATVAADIAKKV